MVAKAASQTRAGGLSVLRLLAGAAVCGVVAGAVLGQVKNRPDALRQAEAVVDRVLPVGAPAGKSVDLMEPDPASLRGIPPYPASSPRRLLGAKPGRGLNAISWFSTPDSLDGVLSYYEREYSSSGVLYVTHRWDRRRGYVSWFESAHARDDGGVPPSTEGVLHMVSASQEGGQTMVFLSATEPEKLLAQVPVLPLGARLPPGAAPQVLDLGEVGQQRATIFAEYHRAGRDAMADELTTLLRESGWAIEERAQGADGRIRVVARQGQRVQLSVVEGTRERSRVLVTVEEGPMR